MTDPREVDYEERSLMNIEDVRQVAEWAAGHPVLGPVARSAMFWHDEMERAKRTAQEWRAEAMRLGWTPDRAREADRD